MDNLEHVRRGERETVEHHNTLVDRVLAAGAELAFRQARGDQSVPLRLYEITGEFTKDQTWGLFCALGKPVKEYVSSPSQKAYMISTTAIPEYIYYPRKDSNMKPASLKGKWAWTVKLYGIRLIVSLQEPLSDEKPKPVTNDDTFATSGVEEKAARWDHVHAHDVPGKTKEQIDPIKNFYLRVGSDTLANHYALAIVSAEKGFDIKGHKTAYDDEVTHETITPDVTDDNIWIDAVQDTANFAWKVTHVGPQPMKYPGQYNYHPLEGLQLSLSGTSLTTTIQQAYLSFDDVGHKNGYDGPKSLTNTVDLSSLTHSHVGDGTWISSVLAGGVCTTAHIGPGSVHYTVFTVPSVTLTLSDKTLSIAVSSLTIGYDTRGHIVTAQTGNAATATVDLSSLTHTHAGDGTWINSSIASGVCTTSHIGPSASYGTYVTPAVTGVDLSLSGTTLSISIAHDKIQFDRCGHRAGVQTGTPVTDSVDLGIVELTVLTDIQVSGNTLQKKTRTIKVIAAGTESGWTTFHTGTNCPS